LTPARVRRTLNSSHLPIGNNWVFSQKYDGDGPSQLVLCGAPLTVDSIFLYAPAKCLVRRQTPATGSVNPKNGVIISRGERVQTATDRWETGTGNRWNNYRDWTQPSSISKRRARRCTSAASRSTTLRPRRIRSCASRTS